MLVAYIIGGVLETSGVQGALPHYPHRKPAFVCNIYFIHIYCTDNLIQGELDVNMFTSCTLNTQGIFAGGQDGILRLIEINNNGVAISQVATSSFRT